MGAAEIEAFLSHLVSVEKVSAATQRQAQNAIISMELDFKVDIHSNHHSG